MFYLWWLSLDREVFFCCVIITVNVPFLWNGCCIWSFSECRTCLLNQKMSLRLYYWTVFMEQQLEALSLLNVWAHTHTHTTKIHHSCFCPVKRWTFSLHHCCGFVSKSQNERWNFRKTPKDRNTFEDIYALFLILHVQCATAESKQPLRFVWCCHIVDVSGGDTENHPAIVWGGWWDFQNKTESFTDMMSL